MSLSQKSIWLIVITLCAALFHLTAGFSWQEFISPNETQQFLLTELRLPRMLLVALVGAALALCGVGLQALFRNPLAEPALIGVSSSAALGAVFVIVLGAELWQQVGFLQIGLGAFISAAIATAIIYALATRYGQTDVALMLLAGVALNAVAGALIQLLVSVSDDAQLRSVTFWLMGSFANVSCTEVLLMALLFLALLLFYVRLSRALNAFALGENICLHMGFNSAALKWQIMLATALITGVAVALVGVIGFVGLIVPHIMRLLVGSQHQWLLPFSALGGALLLLLADFLAKTLLAPGELPVGLFMALLGGPFFLLMLFNQRMKRYGNE